MIKSLIYKLLFFTIFINCKFNYAIEPPKELIIKDLSISKQNIKVDTFDDLSVHYDGWIFDKNIVTDNYCDAKGIKFDSTKDKSFRPNKPIPFNFKIGKGIVIPGWELGLINMRKGSKRCLVIPHQLAYGHRSFDVIPSYSTLIFEIEIIEIFK